MALVSCKECGTEVAASAIACPKCGVSHPGGAGQLLLVRSKAMTGIMYAVQVNIDGKPVADIKNGGSVTFDLLPGKHQLEIRGGGLSNSAVIDIPDGQAIQYEMYFSALGLLGGGLKLTPAKGQ